MATSLVREKDIENYLKREVQKRGGWTRKFSSPSHAGVPDRVVILKGHVGFVELKAPGQKPTALQTHELMLIAEQDVCCWWADSKEDVDGFLDDLEKGCR